jgi:hypothetical protein
MHDLTRRRFLGALPLGTASVLVACSDSKRDPAEAPAASGAAASMPMLDPSDGRARTLGYVAYATQADRVAFENYEPGQQCGNCSLFGGRPGGASGPCPIFAGSHVSAKGWCSAYTRKAA